MPPLTPEYIVQLLFNGVTNGSIYVLIALGLTLMFGVFGVPNFAHGQVFMVGAFVAWVTVQEGLSFWAAILIAAATTAALGIALDRIAFDPVKQRTEQGIPLLLVAFALFELLGVSAELIWGPGGHGFSTPIEGALMTSGLMLTYNRIFIIGVSIVLITLVHLLVQRTRFGKAMRAISQDEDKAATLGINHDRVAIITFAVGSALAGVAGAIIGGVYGLSPQMGLEPILIAFVIVVIGGMGSIVGAIAGGYLVGISEALIVGYYQSEFSTIVTFAILYLILIVRPHGLFGESETR